MSDQRQFRPNLFERFGTWWCRIMHDSPMWPVCGRYRCRACGRSYLVPWAGETVDPAAEPFPIRISTNLAPYSLRNGT
jgi:hypothetical protein